MSKFLNETEKLESQGQSPLVKSFRKFSTIKIYAKKKGGTKMNDKMSEQQFPSMCARCGMSISPGQRMVTVSVSQETPNLDGSIECLESAAISQLCSVCASIILTEAVISQKLVTPDAIQDMEIEEIEDDDDLDDDPSDGEEDEDEEVDNPGDNVVTEEGGGKDEDEDDPQFYDFLITKIVVHYLKVGKALLDEGDYDGAISAFTRAIRLDDANPMVYDSRGIAYGCKGDYDAAIADASRAIAIDATFVGAYNNRALSLYSQGMLDEAIDDYDTAIALAPDIAVFYGNRGLAYYGSGQTAQAIADYSKAIELDHASPEVHNNRGEAYASLGEYEQAMTDFNTALQVNPCDILAYANRFLALKISQDRQVS